ncbi:pentapeptide repeat-containing protein [Enterococcus hermanniensis]|uniref:Uncharacterized protein n=1 Tax=Enterococcus hermanniensis TaxID=249189 RepID=A0A1L8TLN9_9ENTE|nr:pentapeptide repeat-containing protein [Enterococcus hermanniensis]OJG45206.1 hypothetical protein RV04_GL002254 [Enterococcus hermanniensis]
MQQVLKKQNYSFRKSRFANFHDFIFEQINFSAADLPGANLFHVKLENAVIADTTTKFFPFIAFFQRSIFRL